MKNKSVLIGLSGGVDSAVATFLLKQKGYKVIAAFMKNFSETKNKLTGDCNYIQDKKDAQKIAAILDIPLVILNFEDQYKKYVIEPMFKAYEKGQTPNPDSLCNKIIKFPLLWKEAKSLGCDYIATGHYIKKTKTSNGFNLQIPKDKNKDQSYFLYDLTQKDLEHTLFPIANLTKTEVRAIAKKNKFPNHDKKGTKGICFVGKINMKSFLSQKIKSKPGKILNTDKQIIGQHNGVMFYTIGERIRENQNLKIYKEIRNQTKEKLYIASKNLRKNTLTVVTKNHPALKKDKFLIIKINWINPKTLPKFPLTKIKVRIRHLSKPIPATIEQKNKTLHCTLKTPTEGIADGQSLVIYKNKTILGGGEIRFR